MTPVRQPQKPPQAPTRTTSPVRQPAGRAPAAPSPRHGLAPVSPRHGLAPGSGLPEPLKTNIEAMSGVEMGGVRVHRNSSEPARLGALAYTKGGEIHLGAGQEAHLPHEAWHVVQQKQGRVKPTLQMEAAALNDDSGLEREADSMGALAASGGAPRLARVPLAVAPPDIVQCKVGFEFETNLLVNRNGDWLKKKDKVGTGAHQGFTVEADEAGAGKSEIEFVVQPPVEEGEGGFNALRGVMIAITDYATKLEAGGNEAFSLDTVTKQAADSPFVVTPLGPLVAGPQVTTGLDLAKIGRLASISTELETRQPDPVTKLAGPRVGGPAPTELRGTLTSLQLDAEALSAAHKGISPALQGLLVLIRNYLEAGADTKKGQNLPQEVRMNRALNYPKRIADIVLARTDFARLFMLLPRGERRRFADDKQSWVALVLAGLEHVGPGDSVIERGVQIDENDRSKGLFKPDLTVGAWLLGMIGSIGNKVAGDEPDADLLKVVADDKPGADLLRSVPGAESMGELGAKTEKVGGTGAPPFTARTDVGIFEFRSAQRLKIPVERWAPFALEFHRYITAVHD